MKKIVMATLFLTVACLAQAQVAVSGKFSLWSESVKLGGKTTTASAMEPTSNFAFSASEKLGPMTARATVETSLSGNTFGSADTRLGDRQSTVGVAGSNWSVDFGRNVHSQFLAVTSNDVFGTLYGSIAGDVHNLRGLRMSSGTFAAWQPLKGTNVTWERTAAVAGTDATSYSLATTIAGVRATVARWQQGAERSTVLGLSTKVMGTDVTYVHSDDTGALKSKGDSLGLSKRFGPYLAKASYGRTNADVTAYALGVDYSLSKRTELGLALRNVDRKGTASDVTQYGLGLTHRF